MYEAYFGLRGKPFQLNPDPTFFYGSRGHRRAMAYLEYGLHQNEGFIVITGEVGAGKTLLVRSLLEKLDSTRIVAANLVSTQIDADDILRMVAAAFGIPCKQMTKSDLLLAIEAFLVSTTAKGKRALLVVDEAQNLSPRAVEELRMLSNFQLEDHALLQSFLVGQPEFRNIMQSPEMLQLRQRVIASYHLGPLDLTETQAYIEHRLSCVGWKGSPAFEAEANKAIYAFSQGIPRRINALCDRLMLGAFLSDQRNISAGLVEQVTTEMQDEQVVPSPLQAAATGSGGSLQPVGLEQLLANPETVRTLQGLGPGYDAARFEERLALLERTLSATLNVLNQVLTAATGKPASNEEERLGKE
ncbi:XrtA/PEP-CTERM system-associated ATPase [Zoogloea sp.]|uniref:XrtA/PEP-CTERM system-associated ATPase n=1 Tax=Zoogloea sp. TaxID=49181 RepID=UPI0026323E75|nr:XrtA/PEP-CTERM system-associated ATPase [Zoogloea sp.]MDD3352536.1 XrtA-associated ATPase [Zoogloea sp.]